MSFYPPELPDTLQTNESLRASFIQKIKRLWQKTPLYYGTLLGKSSQTLKIVPLDPWPGDASHGRFLLDGKMSIGFSGISLNDLWNPKTLPMNQLAHLHSFDYLRDLRAVGDNMARRLARQLILSWIEKNPNWRSLAWQPDVTGCRIANWLGLYDFFCASADDVFRRLFFKSLSRQLRHLNNTWQDAPSLLHKSYGLFGLIIGTIVLDKADYKLSKLLSVLEDLLRRQLHDDGGHVTRSPLNQLILLRMLIDLRATLRSASLPIPEEIQRSINKMAPLVRLFRHGDGKLSFFGGISPFSANFIDTVLSLADVRGKPPFQAGSMGVERCSTKKGLLLFNAAPTLEACLPKTLEPGTGILNFEWSVGRERIVVSGDVIIQTEKEQYLKASPQAPLLFVHRNNHDKDVFMTATYHSPHSFHSFLHRRQLYLNGGMTDLRGEDHIETKQGSVFALRFILSPHLSPLLSSNGKTVVIRLSDGRTLKLSAAGQEQISLSSLVEYDKSPCILIIGTIRDQRAAAVKWAFREI